jgi:hypothetical protein
MSRGVSSAPTCCGSTATLLQLERTEALARELDLTILTPLARGRALVVAAEQQHDLLTVGVAEDAEQHLPALTRARFTGLAGGCEASRWTSAPSGRAASRSGITDRYGRRRLVAGAVDVDARRDAVLAGCLVAMG